MKSDDNCPPECNTIPVVSPGTHWINLFTDFMLKNRPCVLGRWATDKWLCGSDWVDRNGKNDRAKFVKFIEKYGEMDAPMMIRSCLECQSIKLRDYLDASCSSQAPLGYIKDWHFQRDSGTSYQSYDLCAFLRFDWVNNENWSSNETINPFGDYRFVYFGAANTWTAFHSDVMSSYSWSANVCGRKLWYFVPPGNEALFKVDKHQFLDDIRKAKCKWQGAGVIELVQEEGEIVFVPSNWYHQVHNLEFTLSINHNFINASNVDYVFRLICTRLVDIDEEIAHCASLFTAEEYRIQCEMILKADIRVNLELLGKLLNLVIVDRLLRVNQCWTCPIHRFLFDCKKDTRCLSYMRDTVIAQCQSPTECDGKCKNCSLFMLKYELSCAIECLSLVDHFIGQRRLSVKNIASNH